MLRRSGSGVSEIACDLRPGDVLERVRFAEKSLLTLRFELEEWGVKPARQRIHELRCGAEGQMQQAGGVHGNGQEPSDWRG